METAHKVRLSFCADGPPDFSLTILDGTQMLDIFRKAQAGDEHWKAVVQRYSKMVLMKREKDHWVGILKKELVRRAGPHYPACPLTALLQEWQKKLKNRPIVTGG